MKEVQGLYMLLSGAPGDMPDILLHRLDVPLLEREDHKNSALCPCKPLEIYLGDQFALGLFFSNETIRRLGGALEELQEREDG